jgi:hypothetical protein
MTQQPLDLVGSGNRFAEPAPEDPTEPEISALIALALRALAIRHGRGAAMTSPGATRDYLRLRSAERPNEMFDTLSALWSRARRWSQTSSRRRFCRAVDDKISGLDQPVHAAS